MYIKNIIKNVNNSYMIQIHVINYNLQRLNIEKEIKILLLKQLNIVILKITSNKKNLLIKNLFICLFIIFFSYIIIVNNNYIFKMIFCVHLK